MLPSHVYTSVPSPLELLVGFTEPSSEMLWYRPWTAACSVSWPLLKLRIQLKSVLFAGGTSPQTAYNTDEYLKV